MAQRTYAVMGATGQIGRALVEKLLKRRHTVRALGRDHSKLAALKAKGAETRSAAFDDHEVLAAAFEGAEGVFAMIPPGYGEEDYGAFQDRIGEAIARAIRRAKITHVVSLSSVGAQHPEGTGPIKGLNRQEQRLKRITGLNVVHLRPSYFMENQLFSIPIIKERGVNGSPLRGDVRLGMVATRDIAAEAAELLDDLSFRGQSVVELVGPREVSMEEVTAILGKAIGKPDVRYVQFPEEQARQGMIEMGMKPGTADLMLEMDRGINDGLVAPEGTPQCGQTSLEEFSKTFAAAFSAVQVAA